MCLCVHVHASKCNFWIRLLSLIFLLTLSPLSVQVRLQADYVFPVPRGVRSYCSSFWRQQSCRWLTIPLIRLCFLYRPRQRSQFASLLLSCMSPCQERGKRRESRGSIKSKTRFILSALLLDKKPVTNLSRWQKLRICFSMRIICCRDGS